MKFSKKIIPLNQFKVNINLHNIEIDRIQIMGKEENGLLEYSSEKIRLRLDKRFKIVIIAYAFSGFV